MQACLTAVVALPAKWPFAGGFTKKRQVADCVSLSRLLGSHVAASPEKGWRSSYLEELHVSDLHWPMRLSQGSAMGRKPCGSRMGRWVSGVLSPAQMSPHTWERKLRKTMCPEGNSSPNEKEEYFVITFIYYLFERVRPYMAVALSLSCAVWGSPRSPRVGSKYCTHRIIFLAQEYKKKIVSFFPQKNHK